MCLEAGSLRVDSAAYKTLSAALECMKNAGTAAPIIPKVLWSGPHEEYRSLNNAENSQYV